MQLCLPGLPLDAGEIIDRIADEQRAIAGVLSTLRPGAPAPAALQLRRAHVEELRAQLAPMLKKEGRR